MSHLLLLHCTNTNIYYGNRFFYVSKSLIMRENVFMLTVS